jgi:hypothetical protein
MSKQLLPYGSSQHADLVAKVGDKKPNIRINFFQPYGSSDKASLITKAGEFAPIPPPIPMPPKSPRKVQRLNAKKG